MEPFDIFFLQKQKRHACTTEPIGRSRMTNVSMVKGVFDCNATTRRASVKSELRAFTRQVGRSHFNTIGKGLGSMTYPKLSF